MLCLRDTPSRLAAVLLAGFALAALVGCDSEVGQAAPKKGALSAPEESFERILERIKRRLEHGPRHSFASGGLDPASDETSHFTYEDAVSGEIFKPTEEGGTYTARIVIETHAAYFHSRPTAPEAPKPKPETENGALQSILEGDAGESPIGGDSLVPDELNPLQENGETATDQSDAARSGPQNLSAKESVVKPYDLAYEDGRWVLKTEVKEVSTELIFKYALDGQ